MGNEVAYAFFEVIRKNEYLGGGVLEDLEQFLPVQTPIESGVDGAEFGTGKGAPPDVQKRNADKSAASQFGAVVSI